MGRPVALSELKAAVRSLADQPVGGIITDEELVRFINQGAGKLYRQLCAKWQNDFVTSAQLTASVDHVALPTDFHVLLRAECLVGGAWLTMHSFGWEDAGTPAPYSFVNTYNTAQSYQRRGTDLYLRPSPAPYPTVRIFYIPNTWAKTAGGVAKAKLEDPTDTIEGVIGFEELIVIEAAIKCLQKEESSVTDLVRERERLYQLVESEADNRDVGAPRVAQDTRGWGDY